MGVFGNMYTICVVWLLFVLFYVLFVCKCVLPQGDNPIAVNKYVNIAIRRNGRILKIFTKFQSELYNLVLFFYHCGYGCMFCIFLFNSVSYVFLLL